MARLIETIQGHDQIWERLRAQKANGRLPHAMAFSGPPGVGKKRMAWAFAQLVVCEKPESAPCGECGSCKRIEAGSSESVCFVEPENNAIKLESAHQILEFLSLRRLSRARVVIADQAHLLNPQTANALLKAIEEPPPETFFVFVTPEVSQLLPTLRSRVQNVRFAPLSDEILAQQEDVPEWMLHSARGSFEQLEKFRASETDELRRLALGFLKESAGGGRSILDQAQQESKDRESALTLSRLLQQLIRDWCVLGRGTLVHSDLQAELQALPDADLGRRTDLWKQAFQFEMDVLGNVDRSLLLENFHYRARSALR